MAPWGTPSITWGCWVRIVGQERDPLLLQEALWQLSRIYLALIDDRRRVAWTERVERSLWRGVTGHADSRLKRLFFAAFADLASSREALLRLYRLWSLEETLAGVVLEEDDFIELAEVLAIGLPERADGIVAEHSPPGLNVTPSGPFQAEHPADVAPQQAADPLLIHLFRR